MSSSSSEEPRKRRLKAANKSIRCSTPVEEWCKPRSISISSIRTNSSSSIIARQFLRQPAKAKKKQKLAAVKKERKPAKSEKEQKPAIAEKEQKPAKAKKEKKPARANKEKKPAEKKTKARMNNRKKTKPKESVDTDSDWLTMLEPMDDEKENLEQSVRSPTKGLALFQDTASPELVREAKHFPVYHLESFDLQRRKDAENAVRVDLGDGEKSLPVKDLPHLQSRFDSSDEEEDEMFFRRRFPVKTYPGVQDRRKKKIEIDKCKKWLVDLTVPATAADMLWDEYVRKHPEEMREYIASPAERQEKSLSREDYLNKGDGGKATKEEDWYSREIWISQDVPQDKVRVRGHFDKTLRKWVKINIDPYVLPASKNAKFKRRSTGASDSDSAGPSCSRNERITKKNVANENIKIEQKEKLQRRKPVQRALSIEFQRYNSLSSYATRLKTKEREMLSKNVTEHSNENSLVSAKRITQKRANESNRDDSKRAKIAVGSRPTIKSMQKLVDKRYIKEKDHWRIV